MRGKERRIGGVDRGDSEEERGKGGKGRKKKRAEMKSCREWWKKKRKNTR